MSCTLYSVEKCLERKNVFLTLYGVYKTLLDNVLSVSPVHSLNLALVVAAYAGGADHQRKVRADAGRARLEGDCGQASRAVAWARGANVNGQYGTAVSIRI